MVGGYMERPENKWVYVLTSYIQMIIMWILDLMVTLNEGPKFKDQWIQAILLVESFKLVPRPLDKGPKQKIQQIEAKPYMALIFERKSICLDQTNSAKRRTPDFIWRTKNQAREQDTHFVTSMQGGNLSHLYSHPNVNIEQLYESFSWLNLLSLL